MSRRREPAVTEADSGSKTVSSDRPAATQLSGYSQRPAIEPNAPLSHRSAVQRSAYRFDRLSAPPAEQSTRVHINCVLPRGLGAVVDPTVEQLDDRTFTRYHDDAISTTGDRAHPRYARACGHRRARRPPANTRAPRASLRYVERCTAKRCDSGAWRSDDRPAAGLEILTTHAGEAGR